MFVIRCQKCGASIKGLKADYKRIRADRRECPNCGQGLMLSNYLTCSMFNGLLFGFLTVGLTYWGIGYELARWFLAAVVCWLADPLIVGCCGQWATEAGKSGGVIEWLQRVSSVSGWFLGSAVVLVVVGFVVCYRDFLLEMELLGDYGGADPAEVFLEGVGIRSWVGLGIGFISVVLMGSAGVVLRKLEGDGG